MSIEGTALVGALDEAKAQLKWSDGDVWNRAGVDGCWKKCIDGPTRKRFQIEGDTITTTTNNGSELKRRRWVSPLERCSSTSVKLESTLATLDDRALSLKWSDGDVWTRTLPDQNEYTWTKALPG